MAYAVFRIMRTEGVKCDVCGKTVDHILERRTFIGISLPMEQPKNEISAYDFARHYDVCSRACLEKLIAEKLP
jgi:hypothetical protein